MNTSLAIPRPLSNFIARLRRILRARILKRWGSSETKQAIWDNEFAAGQWDYLERTSEDPVYGYLNRYAYQGSVLDLGCGSGNTGCEMEYSRYDRYTGVDISAQAVRRAEARSKNAGRQKKNEYFCDDIALFEPRERYDVILFRESLFYVPRTKVVGLLDRYRPWLTERGVFIVRMCDRRRYGGIVRRIERNYHVLETSPAADANIIMVFR